MRFWTVNGMRIAVQEPVKAPPSPLLARMLAAKEIPHKQRISINLPPKKH